MNAIIVMNYVFIVINVVVVGCLVVLLIGAVSDEAN